MNQREAREAWMRVSREYNDVILSNPRSIEDIYMAMLRMVHLHDQQIALIRDYGPFPNLMVDAPPLDEEDIEEWDV